MYVPILYGYTSYIFVRIFDLYIDIIFTNVTKEETLGKILLTVFVISHLIPKFIYINHRSWYKVFNIK